MKTLSKQGVLSKKNRAKWLKLLSKLLLAIYLQPFSVASYILLKADQGWSDAQIQEAYGVGHSTVERIRQRYATSGLNGALNRKPSQRVYRKKIEGEEEAYLIALACSEPPEGRASWTLRLLADKLVELKYVESVSYETVRHVLKKTSSSLGKTKNGASRQSKTPALSARWKKF